MNQKVDDKRIVGENDLQEMQTYVNSSHAVQMEIRGHIGGVSTFVIRVFTSKLSKQKMNLRSSKNRKL